MFPTTSVLDILTDTTLVNPGEKTVTTTKAYTPTNIGMWMGMTYNKQVFDIEFDVEIYVNDVRYV
jgi:hypothetical protein